MAWKTRQSPGSIVHDLMSYLPRSASMSGISTRSLDVNLASCPLRNGVGR
jgi:hypothetical protein